MAPTLARHPHRLATHPIHATHGSTLSILPRHPRWYATLTSTPPMSPRLEQITHYFSNSTTSRNKINSRNSYP